MKKDPGAETGRPNTIAGLREQPAPGKQTVCSGSEGKEKHNHYRNNSGPSRRDWHNMMNSLGRSLLAFSGNRVSRFIWEASFPSQIASKSRAK